MKAIVEYKLLGNSQGIVNMYPKNIKKTNYKSTVLSMLEGYKSLRKNEYTMWERYDEFIESSIKESKLNINVYSLKRIKDKYLEMQKNSVFYTNEDFKTVMDDINELYNLIIKEIERLTDKKFGKDYVLV